MELALPSELAAFVQKQVQSGAYASAEDVIKAGLELLHAYESDADTLRAEIAVAIAEANQGNLAPFEPRETLQKVRATRNSRGAADVAGGANGAG